MDVLFFLDSVFRVLEKISFFRVLSQYFILFFSRLFSLREILFLRLCLKERFV